MVMSSAQLVRPDMRYATSLIAAAREFQAEGRMANFDYADVALYIKNLRRREHDPRPGKVLETYLWLVEGDEYIGRASVRHALNDSLRQIGGHIGYEIRPTRRKMGYGNLICKLALDEARKIGLKRVLITCDSTNIGSRKIIEANGGVLEDEIVVEGHPVTVLRWWIDL